jgi:hypothetical protein
MRRRKPYGAILKGAGLLRRRKDLFRVHDAAMSGIVAFLRQVAAKIFLFLQWGRVF